MSFSKKILDCQPGWTIRTWNYNYGRIAHIERGVGIGKVIVTFTNGDVRTYAAKIYVTVLSTD